MELKKNMSPWLSLPKMYYITWQLLMSELQQLCDPPNLGPHTHTHTHTRTLGVFCLPMTSHARDCIQLIQGSHLICATIITSCAYEGGLQFPYTVQLNDKHKLAMSITCPFLTVKLPKLCSTMFVTSIAIWHSPTYAGKGKIRNPKILEMKQLHFFVSALCFSVPSFTLFMSGLVRGLHQITYWH